MGVVLIVVGLLLWLLAGYFVIGLILIIVGVLLLFAPWPGAYGYGWYRGRGAPPP
jgi:hypothetical protein